jgi:hypothetical protein
MAIALHDAWRPIWSKPDPPPSTIYKKKITSPIPEVTIELVMDTLSKRADSSTGPDGIPFSVYRLLSDVAGPIFLQVFVHLTTGGRAYKSFNRVNLQFFPKDSSMEALRCRPIASPTPITA